MVVRLRCFSMAAGLCRETLVGGDLKKARSDAAEPLHTNRAAVVSSEAIVRFNGLRGDFPTLRRLIDARCSVASITRAPALSS